MSHSRLQVRQFFVSDSFLLLTENIERARVPDDSNQSLYGTYYTEYTDIWALGLLLFYLCTGGCLPWEKACTLDPRYSFFLNQDEDYLLHLFPISRQLNHLLKQIFTPNFRNRPKIPQIKCEIEQMETFYSFTEDGLDWEDALKLNSEDHYSAGFTEMWSRKRIAENPVEYGNLEVVRYRSREIARSFVNSFRYVDSGFDAYDKK